MNVAAAAAAVVGLVVKSKIVNDKMIFKTTEFIALIMYNK